MIRVTRLSAVRRPGTAPAAAFESGIAAGAEAAAGCRVRRVHPAAGCRVRRMHPAAGCCACRVQATGGSRRRRPAALRAKDAVTVLRGALLQEGPRSLVCKEPGAILTRACPQKRGGREAGVPRRLELLAE